MELTITWPELLIAIVLATLVYLLETILLARRRSGKNSGELRGLSDKINELQVELAALRNRIDVLENHGHQPQETKAGEGNATYDYAVQYARQGMIAPEIAARCGISQDEAALIVALHRTGNQ